MSYIGVDLHTTQITVCYLKAEEDFEIRKYQLIEMEKFVNTLEAGDQIAVEATGNTRWFSEQVASIVRRVVLVNPRQFEVVKNSCGSNIFLLTANADGSGAMTLPTQLPLAPQQPAWSPDGTKIVFTSFQDIFAINADGTAPVNLTNTQIGIDEKNPSWSATGKIAYERGNQIWTMNADGSNQAAFSAIAQPSPLAPAWSPDGSKLAFTSGGEIYVINADGANERRVTNNSTTDADPNWSPDGSKIIFGKGATGIAVINLDGTNETNLTNGTQDGKPAWSSDGTKIAFVRRGTAVGVSTADGIYVMDAVGANQVRIVVDKPTSPGRSQSDNPAWQPVSVPVNTFIISGRITRVGASLSGATVTLSGSISATTVTDSTGSYQFGNLPTGGSHTVTPSLPNHVFTPPSRTFNNLNTNQIADFTATETCPTPNCATNGKIAFVRDADIFTMSPDGSNLTNITNNPAADTAPAYSPDGSKIIFVSDRDGNNEIYTMNADGGGAVRLTNNSVFDGNPSFSPDGSKIAYERDSQIWTMNADGSSPVRLTNNATYSSQPSYSPDGSKIIFVRLVIPYPLIFTMNADGSNQSSLSPLSGYYSDPSYSPDGSKIIFIYGADIFQKRAHTMNADGTNLTRFPAPFPVDFNPSYSPDGGKVVYACCVFVLQLNGIWTVNANGTSPVQLTTGFSDRQPKWQPLRRARPRTAFDFDGDGRADLTVFRASNGFWYELSSQNNSFIPFKFGQNGDRIAPADYDGDGRTDFAVWRDVVFGAGNRAYFYITNSSDGSFRPEQFGATGDVPVSGDWDGDGRADLAVYRDGSLSGGQGYFFYRPSSAPGVDFRAIAWGTNGDKPVVGDFDGDGKLDAAVFRPSAGTWYYLQSSNNQYVFLGLGIASDIPAPADFDGDGKTNIAVFRPSNGTWYTSPNPQTNYGAIQFGAAGDLPVPADYDGDGQADIAVFRPSNGTWYLLRTTAGFTGVQFGKNEDKPVPSAFVP